MEAQRHTLLLKESMAIGYSLNWTKVCFILSYDYDIINGRVLYNKQTSKTASINFNKTLGANEIIEYKFKNRKEPRTGAIFKKPITHSLILMSR